MPKLKVGGKQWLRLERLEKHEAQAVEVISGQEFRDMVAATGEWGQVADPGSIDLRRACLVIKLVWKS